MTQFKSAVLLLLAIHMTIPGIVKGQSICQAKICQNLYIGGITTPPEADHLMDLRKSIRQDLAAILQSLSACTFVERSDQIDGLIEREGSVFSEHFYDQILQYQPNLSQPMDLILTGDISGLPGIHKYSVSIKITDVGSRLTTKTFTFPFTYNSKFDYQKFISSLSFQFVRSLGLLTKIVGETNSKKINVKNFSVFPEPWVNTLKFDNSTNRFEFYIPKCKVSRQPLRIKVNLDSFTGQIDTTLNESVLNLEELFIGTLRLNSTRGLKFDFKWRAPLHQWNDFKISKIYVFSPSPINRGAKSASYTIDNDGFMLMMPLSLSIDSKVEVVLKSKNYPHFKQPGAVSANHNTLSISPGTIRKSWFNKIIPGWHQIQTGKPILGFGLFAATSGLFYGFLEETSRARSNNQNAINASTLASYNYYKKLANKHENNSELFLISALVIYAVNWIHGLLAPYAKPVAANNYSAPLEFKHQSIQGGVASINLTL